MFRKENCSWDSNTHPPTLIQTNLSPLAILDLTKRSGISDKINGLVEKLNRPQLNVYKVHIYDTCDTLNTTEIKADSHSNELMSVSSTHICLVEQWNKIKSIEKTRFNVVRESVEEFYINTPTSNDCGRQVGFNSLKGYKKLGEFIGNIGLTHNNNYCVSECVFEAHNSSSQALRDLCPACMECEDSSKVTEDQLGCGETGFCSKGGCFKEQWDGHQIFLEWLSDFYNETLEPFIYDIGFLTIMSCVATLILLVCGLPLKRELESVNVWSLYIFVVLDLILSWDIIKSLLIPNTCLIICPIRFALRFMIYFMMSLSLWLSPLPPITLRGLSYMGIANLILTVLVMVFDQVGLKQSCNDMEQMAECGSLDEMKQHYYWSILAVYIIHGLMVIVRAQKDAVAGTIWMLVALALSTFGFSLRFSPNYTIMLACYAIAVKVFLCRFKKN